MIMILYYYSRVAPIIADLQALTTRPRDASLGLVDRLLSGASERANKLGLDVSCHHGGWLASRNW